MTTSDAASARDRAIVRARAERRESSTEPPPRHQRPTVAPGPGRGLAPISDDVATLAVTYIKDGYAPDDVAARLGVDRGWCRAMAARLRGGDGR